MTDSENSTVAPQEQNEELSVEEKLELEKRMKILIDQANQVFNRSITNIDSLHRKIITHFQIFLVLISIEVVVITYHTQNGFQFSYFSKFLLIWVSCWGLFSLISLVILLIPRWYKDVSVFEEKRFDELCKLNSIDLLSDFLYQTKDAFQYNDPIYYRITVGLTVSYVSVIVMTISYIILIISLRI
jgi:hypothetical protein